MPIEKSSTIIATCDSCAEGSKSCTTEPESGAYICEDCLGFHERAIEAAARAIHPPSFGDFRTAGCRCEEMARTVVDVYCSFTDEKIPQGYPDAY